MSTTQIGDQFRDNIVDLLKAAGYKAVSEVLLGHKKMDIIFEKEVFGKRRRYAIEAKSWSTALNHGDLERIYAGYSSALRRGDINDLLIISPHEISSAAGKKYVEDTHDMSHLTFYQFQNSIMDFTAYISNYIYNHEKDGLEEYFISPSLESGDSLEDHFDKWLKEPISAPIAIIAGYGMGKTSFAKHITYKLAKTFSSGGSDRIPILVPLGSIAREQTLEGLLGSILAGTNPTVGNYSFPLFARLNDIGRFVIILDGFDEMKHMMSWAEFQSNFDELNRLVEGRARVLLLGRPTAFLSDDERVYALRGVRRFGSGVLKTPGKPIYSEITLPPFSPSQVKRFLDRYLAYHHSSGHFDGGSDFLERRRKEIGDMAHESLLARPVHAKMLADVATDSAVDISGISRYTLYDHFIDHLIQREIRKPGRGALYKGRDRRDFACDLAWHLWAMPGSSGGGCKLDDLPASLFEKYRVESEDLLSTKRALLSASFLDEKHGGVYFFAHRSFQEFLVAEYIWNLFDELGENSEIDDAKAELICQYTTQEIFDFLSEREDKVFFTRFSKAMSWPSQGVPESFLNCISASKSLREACALKSPSSFGVWDAAVLLHHVLSEKHNNISVQLEPNIRLIADRIRNKSRISVFAILMILRFGPKHYPDPVALIPSLISMIFWRADKDFALLKKESKRPSVREPLLEIIFECIVSFLNPRPDGQSSLQLVVDLTNMNTMAAEHCDFHIIQRQTQRTWRNRVIVEFDQAFSACSSEVRDMARKFYIADAGARQPKLKDEGRNQQ